MYNDDRKNYILVEGCLIPIDNIDPFDLSYLPAELDFNDWLNITIVFESFILYFIMLFHYMIKGW